MMIRHTSARSAARKADASVSTGTASPVSASSHGMSTALTDMVQSSLNGGHALEPDLRRYYESRLGFDLGKVRVHRDERSSRSAAGLGARAWTLGRHVVFGRDEYRPGTTAGRHLLAHELAHVGQHQPIIRRVPVTQEEIAASQTSPGGVAAGQDPFMVSLYNFGIGSALLKAEHLHILDELASLHTNYGVRFHIAGHTDSTDSEAVNLGLSGDRMNAVVDAFYPLGVYYASTSFHGESRPIADNTTPAGRSRNRRVDIILYPDPEYVPDRPVPPGDSPGRPPSEPPEEPPGGRDDDSWFCEEHPILCALLGGGAGALAFCITNPWACIPIPWPPGLPPPGPPETPEPETPEPENPEDLPCGHPRMPLTHVTFYGDGSKGVRIVADPLTRCPGNTVGSMPISNPHWPTGWECVVSSGQTNRWVRAHLLHGPSSLSVTNHLHGPGNNRANIIISDHSINLLMYLRAESDAVDRIHNQHQVLRYEVSVNHFSGAYPRPYFAESVDMTYDQKDPVTGARTNIFDDTIASNVGHQPPPCTPPTIPSILPPTTPTFTPPHDYPTIGPAPSTPGIPIPPTGLCLDRRISCAAADEMSRYVFPDREAAVRLEYDALTSHCAIFRPFDPEEVVQYWLPRLYQLAERRVDNFITWRIDVTDRPLEGPCP